MNRSHFLIYLPKILLQIARDFLYFPLWWYSVGLWRTLLKVVNFISEQQISLGLSVWVKNIFTPMYGQRDFTGKAISFFMRLIQIMARSIAMLFWLILSFIFIAFWLALPPLVVGAILYQLL
ncbi:hypothetical protein COT98_02705 [Candidatus Falkowbacteria bacterium CG10_big_fil_rev_8_21_14_0_10_39_9]|uniref:Uncharacterized protein n=1 Tax=Candidatus Falkowbacteria bacterium CG10_big_fil_rev_8_21_14_0_10_39_9 TaxID=1974566 RepID=A0A2M6WPA1_9BACT|nr:MAG: hypothetical protein COT98_02705 [Candidatus Falkowbacteria bacterium CG10_big_fil_rev_8_21_14_0_10_39_9]